MGKLLRKFNNLGRRNAGLITIGGLVLTALLVWPEAPREVAERAQSGTWFDNAGDWESLLANSTADGTLRVHIQYNAGTLEHIATLQASGVKQEYGVESTTAAGQLARFDLICGTTRCGTKDAFYSEPLTFFVVNVPDGIGATKVTATVGAAYLEVDL